MKSTLKLAMLVIVYSFVMTSCKKDKKTMDNMDADETSAFTQQSNDQKNSQDVADLAMNDAEYALAPSSLSGYKTSAYPNLCGASVDTSMITTQKKVVITYTGTTCDGLRTRSGVVTLQLTTGNKWRDAGAVLTVTFANFKVTVISSGKSTTLNGTHVITNVSGGIVAHIGLTPNPNTIVRKIRANNMVITFDDGTVRTWSAARKRTWTGAGGIITSLSIQGDSTLSGVSNTEVWGVNRAGNAFTTVMNTPLVVNSTCGWYSPVSGKKTHTIGTRISSITFGTDATGNVVSSGCPNHYLINWTSLSGTQKTYVGMY